LELTILSLTMSKLTRPLLPANAKRILYTLVPRDEHGEVDVGKTRTFAQIMAIIVSVLASASMIFYLLRLLWCYDHLAINEFYYGVIAALSSQVAIEAMSVAFAVFYVMGAFKRQTGFIFLWLVSALVLLSLGTLVTVYASVVRDQSVGVWDPGSRVEIAVFVAKLIFNIPAIIAAVALYKALTVFFESDSDEREILL